MRHPTNDRYGRMGPRGGRAHHESAEMPSADGIEGWFAGRLPDGWFEGQPRVTVDRDEVIVVGTVAAPAAGADEAATAAAEAGRITRFREETREQRISIAREAEHRYGRKVAWGATGGTRQVFTTVSVPVMTRLRQPERQVLDTLVDSGVAHSRSEALAWCVKLVGNHADDWLDELRTAMRSVQKVRDAGPTS